MTLKDSKKNFSVDIRNSLDLAIDKLGKNDWYLTLHYYRFFQTLRWITKRVTMGSKGLEIGVWPGYLGSSLQNLGFKETGLDLEPERLSSLDFPALKLDLNFELLPFAENTFEFATLSEVVEHINEKQVPEVLKGINKILKPNGFLFITTPNRYRFGRALNKNISNVEKHGHGHEHEYSLEEISKISKECGFKIIKAQHISFYSGVGKIEENKYFYPLINFYKYKNKKRNLIKTLAYPILKYISQMNDSIFLILQK